MSDAPQVKFEADELEMGLPPDAGRGIGPFLNFDGGEQALYSQVLTYPVIC